MLIDLANDPHETRNLVDDQGHAQVRNDLAALARKHALGAR
jgi:hypothetical protein